MPFIAVLLGVLGMLNAKDAVDPRRVRQQSMIALLTGGIITLVMVSCILGYVFIYGSIIASLSAGGNSGLFSTIVFATPAPTVMTFSTVDPASTQAPTKELFSPTLDLSGDDPTPTP